MSMPLLTREAQLEGTWQCSQGAQATNWAGSVFLYNLQAKP